VFIEKKKNGIYEFSVCEDVESITRRKNRIMFFELLYCILIVISLIYSHLNNAHIVVIYTLSVLLGISISYAIFLQMSFETAYYIFNNTYSTHTVRYNTNSKELVINQVYDMHPKLYFSIIDFSSITSVYETNPYSSDYCVIIEIENCVMPQYIFPNTNGGKLIIEACEYIKHELYVKAN
jgi:hypothetical protein